MSNFYSTDCNVPTYKNSSIRSPTDGTISTESIADHFVKILRTTDIGTIVVVIQTNINTSSFTVWLQNKYTIIRIRCLRCCLYDLGY
jgi:hypothetical protein